MRPIPHKFLVTAAIFGSLLTGCEWTASDGTSTWSSRYDAMHFSGTYRVTLSSEGTTGGTGGATGTPQVGSVSGVSIGTVNDSSTGFVMTLRPDLVPGSVSISVGNLTWNDDGAGKLTPPGVNGQNVPGTVVYSSGAISLTFPWPISGTVRASYSYNFVTTIDEDGETLTHVTVNQNGQHLEMLFSNGLNLKGNFTTINESGEATQLRYNASFEVSGGGARFVGTLNDTTAERLLEGTLVQNGSSYEINARASGSAVSTAGATN